MFTGIVAEVGTITLAQNGKLTVTGSGIIKKLALGESISVNGVCLTVTNISGNTFSADIMSETLVRSNLDDLSPGARVNLEPALSMGSSMGGHMVQGHVDAVGAVASTYWSGAALIIKINAPDDVMRYVVEKGFISVNGISLTVVARDSKSFQVSVVGYTRENTILDNIQVGDKVNLEVDIIAKYVEQLGQSRQGGITAEFLQEHGFPVN